MWCYLMWPDLVICGVMLCDAMRCYVMIGNVMLLQYHYTYCDTLFILLCFPASCKSFSFFWIKNKQCLYTKSFENYWHVAIFSFIYFCWKSNCYPNIYLINNYIVDNFQSAYKAGHSCDHIVTTRGVVASAPDLERAGWRFDSHCGQLF